MTASGYLRALALAVTVWVGLFLAFTWTIDPYRVFPVRVDLPRINAIHPKRLAIDRILKPYEVWRYQPRSIFLGTSRFHQSIDPSLLEGTRFAPAYNAAIPGATMETNAAYLRQYIRLNPNLRTVFVEVFLNNFIQKPSEIKPMTLVGFMQDTASLFVSSEALWDSVATLTYNALDGRPTAEITPGGYLYYSPGSRGVRGNFDGYEDYVWGPEYPEPDRATLYPQVFDSVRDIVELARKHDLELIFVVTPSYAFVEHYHEAIGAWDVIARSLTALSGLGAVYSFSQPNDWTSEPLKDRMMYWHDPYHFSLEMGRAMLARLAQSPISGTPDNFMEELIPETVGSHVENRRQAARRWAEANPSFVSRLELARRKWHILKHQDSRAGRQF